MIKVFSTRTRDIINNIDTGEKFIRNGGPAFFIEKVFKKNKVKYKIIFQKAEVEIKIEKGSEDGILRKKLRAKKIENIKSENIIIISTVDSEWILDAKIFGGAQVFLDIQGYIRNVKKVFKMFQKEVWKDIFCLKSNEQEIKKIPKRIINNQKKKCLIITKGEKGAVIYFKNKKHIFITERIKSKDTIGAGDTFFAGFITEFIKSEGNIEKSGKFAIKETEKFLIKK